jgi:hypothetical protein
MRIPFRTESDVFRVVEALGLATGISILIGWLARPAYGIVAFAAALAAGLTFELVGREPDRRAPLREASQAPHPHGAPTGKRHVLVVASEPLAGDELVRELGRGEDVELDVLAPILASRAHYWASDVDDEREEARRRLEASLAWAAGHGLTAKGEVADPDPLVAIEDELRDFGADEVIVVTHPRDSETWQERGELERLRAELDVPVVHVVARDGAE